MEEFIRELNKMDHLTQIKFHPAGPDERGDISTYHTLQILFKHNKRISPEQITQIAKKHKILVTEYGARRGVEFRFGLQHEDKRGSPFIEMDLLAGMNSPTIDFKTKQGTLPLEWRAKLLGFFNELGSHKIN